MSVGLGPERVGHQAGNVLGAFEFGNIGLTRHLLEGHQADKPPCGFRSSAARILQVTEMEDFLREF